MALNKSISIVGLALGYTVIAIGVFSGGFGLKLGWTAKSNSGIAVSTIGLLVNIALLYAWLRIWFV